VFGNFQPPNQVSLNAWRLTQGGFTLLPAIEGQGGFAVFPADDDTAPADVGLDHRNALPFKLTISADDRLLH